MYNFGDVISFPCWISHKSPTMKKPPGCQKQKPPRKLLFVFAADEKEALPDIDDIVNATGFFFFFILIFFFFF